MPRIELEEPDDDQPESPEQPAAGRPEDEPSPTKSGWRRVRDHRAFIPTALALGSLAVGGVVLLATRVSGPAQLMTGRIPGPPELPINVADNAVKAVTRSSPIPHIVSGFERRQHFGTENALTKMVQIDSYLRGGRG